MSPLLSDPLFLDALMQAKPLDSLSDASWKTITRIESFDVTKPRLRATLGKLCETTWGINTAIASYP